jgi:hypothetical protein
MPKSRFSSCPYNDEITTCGDRVLTFAKCTTIMVVELAVTSGLGSSLDWMVGMWDGLNGSGVDHMDWCDP